MGFWNDPKPPEAKRVYRWLLYIGTLDPWIAKKVTKPSFTMTETKHSYLNHTYYYPGRVEWQTIDVTLVDPALPDIAQTVMAIMEGSGYIVPASPTHTPRTIGKDTAGDALGGVKIEQIDSFGKMVERWTLKGAFLKDAKFPELSYDADDIAEITLTLRYDWAELETVQQSYPVNQGTDAAAKASKFPSGKFGASGPG
jgi:hypothetical protein